MILFQAVVGFEGEKLHAMTVRSSRKIGGKTVTVRRITDDFRAAVFWGVLADEFQGRGGDRGDGAGEQ
ncbi:hypothetical protein FEM03_07245 [Phragmitibacter flavus]|uniref:Uncharacterized protein n=1 Tax=Phragmitibacter flavus TaxID=2576071 RepID=A0A5R8KG85_9BACT|nr:hypothetical protein FEM03_07245 [Phragmitibacter flavus]